MYKSEIDIAHDCTIDFFTSFLEKYNLKANLIAANGPGGGNPCFELLCSNKNELLMALAEFHDILVTDPDLIDSITK